ncbi:hypothetical protein Tco_0845351, partial [Tanacetum coccineum]
TDDDDSAEEQPQAASTSRCYEKITMTGCVLFLRAPNAPVYQYVKKLIKIKVKLTNCILTLRAHNAPDVGSLSIKRKSIGTDNPRPGYCLDLKLDTSLHPCFPPVMDTDTFLRGETWHLKRDTCPKLMTHLQGLVDIVKEHTVYDQNFPKAGLVAAGMSKNWSHDGFQPCFMEGENDFGLIGMGEMGENVIMPLRTSSRNTRETDPRIPPSSGVINKRPCIATNEGRDKSPTPLNAITLYVNEPSIFQAPPIFATIPGHTNVTPAIMSPRGTAQGVQHVFETPIASVPDNVHNSNYERKRVLIKQIIGGHRDNAHQLAMRLLGGIDSDHSLFFTNEEFVTGAQIMVQKLNTDIECLRAKIRDLKEKYDIALQLGNVVESLSQENAAIPKILCRDAYYNSPDD